jgi:hypothetical protein
VVGSSWGESSVGNGVVSLDQSRESEIGGKWRVWSGSRLRESGGWQRGARGSRPLERVLRGQGASGMHQGCRGEVSAWTTWRGWLLGQPDVNSAILVLFKKIQMDLN